MPALQSIIHTIVSGGQAGVDRAALDFAIAVGIAHGGWCPKGRKAEDGAIPAVYQLKEINSGDYRQRTRLNVQDSEATLVFNMGVLEGGSLLTVEVAKRMQKPCLVIQLDDSDREEATASVIRWLVAGGYHVLNIAGPRESKRPGIYRAAHAFLEQLNATGRRGTRPERVSCP